MKNIKLSSETIINISIDFDIDKLHVIHLAESLSIESDFPSAYCILFHTFVIKFCSDGDVQSAKISPFEIEELKEGGNRTHNWSQHGEMFNSKLFCNHSS